MKQTTHVYAKFESKGKPDETIVIRNMSLQFVVVSLTRWLLKVAMGHKIVITIGRDEDAIQSTDSSANEMIDMLEQIMAEAEAEQDSKESN